MKPAPIATNASSIQTADHPPAYFRGVDGLRALAVLAVMIFHLNEKGGLRGGLVGVDVFFVISGFVVTSSVAHLNFRTFQSFVAFFYVRRIRRIFPALSVCLAVTFLAYALFIPSAWLSDTIPRTGEAAFIGISNIVLAVHSDDYFSPQATFNPFTHTWSLGVEEQFYLIFPFLMFAFQRASNSAIWRARLVALISAGCLISLAICAFATPSHFRFAFYMLPSRFWELAAGMLLRLTMEQWRPFLRSHGITAKLISYACLALILLTFVLPIDSGFPWPIAIMPVAATAGLIAVIVAEAESFVVAGFSSPAPVYIGKLSYSLYLWHWPIFVLMRWTWGLNTIFDWGVGVSLTFLLAFASYRLVEKPLRYVEKEGRKKTALLFAGALVVGGSCYFVSSALASHKYAVSLSVTRDAAVWYPDPNPSVQSANGCHVSRLIRKFSGVTEAVFSPEGCIATSSRLFVAGDSHAGAYAAMLSQFARDTGAQVHLYSYPGCSFAQLSRPAIGDCVTGQNAITKEIERSATQKDIVFLPSLRLDRFADQWGTAASLPPLEREKALQEAISIVRRFHNAQVVFEVPTPLFRAPPFRCSDWFNRNNPDCIGGFALKRSEFEQLKRPVVDQMHKLQSRFSNVSAWDPTPTLCEQDYCYAAKAGVPLFFDGDHLSGHANMILLPSFKQFLRPYFSPAKSGD